jgi:HK97 family phage major capsid protein
MAVDKKKLVVVLGELEKLQNDYKGKNMPEDVGAKFDALAAEAKTMQDEVDAEKKSEEREKQVKNLRRFADEIPDPALPAKKDEENGKGARIAGYITPGQMFATSPVLQAFAKARFPRTSSLPVEVRNLLPISGQPQGLIALTENECKAYMARVSEMESKSLEGKDVTDVIPVFGLDVIAPNRVDRFVQVTRPDILTLRDVLNVSPTSSPVIDYVREVSYSESAGIVSEGATKPQAAVEYEKVRANVVTIAVWIPVTEQQLADAPALINRINSRLLWDVRKAEEQEIGYGDGTGEHFEGLFDSGSGISAMRTEVGDTLIDIARRGVTDVLTSGYNPNAIWIHPEDWEVMELAKGSDGQYVWAIIRDVLGPRLWGLRVVQGVGTRISGGTTTNMAVGDWQAGATLYDRQQASIAVGWINEQFIENMRTIRAEERAAWALEAPKAFRIHETAS